MPPPDNDIGVAELARQVRDVLMRFQALADRLDSAYTSKEMFSLYKILVDQALATLQEKVNNLDRDKVEKSIADSTDQRLKKLEDNQTWLVRLLVSLIIVAVVGTVIVTGGGK
jgi:DNA-binding PucR family transcriptional regulator